MKQRTSPELDHVTLTSGGRRPGTVTTCLLEACSEYANEPEITHRPMSVDPYLAMYGRNLNDLLPHEHRQALTNLIPSMVGTAGDGAAHWRLRTLLQFAVATAVPAAADSIGLRGYFLGFWNYTLPPTYAGIVRSMPDIIPQLRMMKNDAYTVMGRAINRPGSYNSAQCGIAHGIADVTARALHNYQAGEPDRWEWSEQLDLAAECASWAIRYLVAGAPGYYPMALRLMSLLTLGPTAGAHLRGPLCPACKCSQLMYEVQGNTLTNGWSSLCPSCEELLFSPEHAALGRHMHDDQLIQLVPMFDAGDHIGWRCPDPDECDAVHLFNR